LLKNNKGTRINLIRFERNEKAEVSDLVAREIKITIFVNKEKLISLSCSPGNYNYLAAGFLFTSGILQNKEDISSIKIGRRFINVEIKNIPHSIKGITNSVSLKLSRQQTQKQVEPVAIICRNPKINPSAIYSLISEIQEKALFFKQSGSVHSCALADFNGSILLFSEDISRYNTIDRILGEALLTNISLKDKIMLTSCRITEGIIEKIISGNIPIIISRSALTDCAVKLAHQKGITMIGFARGERMNVYTHPWRVHV